VSEGGGKKRGIKPAFKGVTFYWVLLRRIKGGNLSPTGERRSRWVSNFSEVHPPKNIRSRRFPGKERAVGGSVIGSTSSRESHISGEGRKWAEIGRDGERQNVSPARESSLSNLCEKE